jgi:hypothetical protein
MKQTNFTTRNKTKKILPLKWLSWSDTNKGSKPNTKKHKNMEKGKNYSFSQIEEWANDNQFNLIELGESTIGKNFIVAEHDHRDLTVSFILDGYIPALGNQYTCIYSDKL